MSLAAREPDYKLIYNIPYSGTSLIDTSIAYKLYSIALTTRDILYCIIHPVS